MSNPVLTTRLDDSTAVWLLEELQSDHLKYPGKTFDYVLVCNYHAHAVLGAARAGWEESAPGVWDNSFGHVQIRVEEGAFPHLERYEQAG